MAKCLTLANFRLREYDTGPGFCSRWICGPGRRMKYMGEGRGWVRGMSSESWARGLYKEWVGVCVDEMYK